MRPRALVRHGQSAANAGLATADPASIPLTDLGRAQSEAVARAWPHPPPLLVRSPYLRTQHTSDPTRARFPAAPLEEWPIQEFTFLSPVRHRDTSVAERSPHVRAFWDAADPHLVDGEGAESFAAFWARVDAFWTRIHAAPEGTIAFGHGQFMQLLLFQRMGYQTAPTSAAMRQFRFFAQGLVVPNTARIWIADHRCSGLDLSHLSAEQISV